MEITILRTWFRDCYTVGYLKINGKYHCDTLELRAIDWTKEKKTWGKTAIPEGRYRVRLQYSSHFKRVMPYLENVPQFTGVMIHTGNSAGYGGKKSDTTGCILVGKNTIVGELTESRVHFKSLMEQIQKAVSAGEEVWVHVLSVKKWTL